MEISVNGEAGEYQNVIREEEASDVDNMKTWSEDDRSPGKGIPIIEEFPAVDEADLEENHKRARGIFIETGSVDEQISENQHGLIDPEEVNEEKKLREVTDVLKTQKAEEKRNSWVSSDVTEDEVKSAEDKIAVSLDGNLMAEMVSEGVNWIGNTALPNSHEVLHIMGSESKEATSDKTSVSVPLSEDEDIKHSGSGLSDLVSKDTEISPDSDKKIEMGLNENSNESLQPAAAADGGENSKERTGPVEFPSSNEDLDTINVLEPLDVKLSTIEKTSELVDLGSNGDDLVQPVSDSFSRVQSSGFPEQSNETQIHESAEVESTIDIPSSSKETTWKSCCGMFDVLRGWPNR